MAKTTSSQQPRPEYPRPQFQRAQWMNLNGQWEFEFDQGDSGLERGVVNKPQLDSQITVPFAPESELSGIHHTDFIAACWYRKTVKIPRSWAGRDRILLHFQASDYDTTVFVNGKEISRHRGGFTPFTVDLKGVATPGKDVTLVVRARDTRTGPQARGKQSTKYENYACFYIRTTGIWQTVWLEPVSDIYLKRSRITPDVAGGVFRLEQPLNQNRKGYSIRATLYAPRVRRSSNGASGSGQAIATATVRADLDFAPRLDLVIPKKHLKLWDTGEPNLYDLKVELLNAKKETIDEVMSYAGLRSVTLEGRAIKINGATVFQRLVLDQGFYPDGIFTAPSDKALIEDIQLALDAGFNGARLHQKVFDERFLYHADRMGYLCWGEFPDWGCAHYGTDSDHQQPTGSYITQWLEALERDYSHPSIIGWCPLNETWQVLHDRITVLDDITRGMFLATKAMDTTRPVLDTSGYSHRVAETDVFDCHDYEQNPEKFARNHCGTCDGNVYYNKHQNVHTISCAYNGQPFFVSEFGGIWWNPKAREGEHSWGYGDRPKSIEEFYTRFEGLCAALLEDASMFGYCYTQLTDVFQEQNGIYGFDRSRKFDMKRIRNAQTKPAAIEKLKD